MIPHKFSTFLLQLIEETNSSHSSATHPKIDSWSDSYDCDTKKADQYSIVLLEENTSAATVYSLTSTGESSNEERSS